MQNMKLKEVSFIKWVFGGPFYGVQSHTQLESLWKFLFVGPVELAFMKSVSQ